MEGSGLAVSLREATLYSFAFGARLCLFRGGPRPEDGLFFFLKKKEEHEENGEI